MIMRNLPIMISTPVGLKHDCIARNGSNKVLEFVNVSVYVLMRRS